MRTHTHSTVQILVNFPLVKMTLLELLVESTLSIYDFDTWKQEKMFSENKNVISTSTYQHTKLMNQRNQRHEPKVAINLGLDLPELIHYAPPHRKHVQITLFSAILHQVERFLQSLLQAIQRLLYRRQSHQVR